VKVYLAFNNVTVSLQNERYLLICGMARVVVGIVLTSHLIACMWYFIGTWDESSQNTWVKENQLQNQGVGYRYFTALHWALTQFTPASMEVVPRNFHERAFSVFILLFAIVMFSSLMSSISNAMTRLQFLNSKMIKEHATIRMYLGENKVSASVTRRIWECLQHVKHKSSRRLHSEELTALCALPWDLLTDLQEEVHGPVLAAHPFFRLYAAKYTTGARRIYHDALQEISVTGGSVLFHAGDEALNMYFVRSGCMRYCNAESTSQDVPSGQWASEPGLWIKWQHAGQLSGKDHCELLELKLHKVVEEMREKYEAMRYAKSFAEYFTKNPHLLEDVYIDTDGSLSDDADFAFTMDFTDEDLLEVQKFVDGADADGLASVSLTPSARRNGRVSGSQSSWTSGGSAEGTPRRSNFPFLSGSAMLGRLSRGRLSLSNSFDFSQSFNFSHRKSTAGVAPY